MITQLENRHICIDATIVLGLNSLDDNQRIATKNFIIQHLSSVFIMSYEQVAICDERAWNFDFSIQKLYWPFIDYIHTKLNFKRVPYNQNMLEFVNKSCTLSTTDQLTCSVAEEYATKLYTWNSNILREVPERTVGLTSRRETENIFPDTIEKLYNKSLALKIAPDNLL